ncbi:MAG: site-specific DNA-methyltransferase [Firmicutes bacterium]|nr:site-specific DNA-methyltransferase [Bacillota bacterium]
MSLLAELPEIVKTARIKYENIMDSESCTEYAKILSADFGGASQRNVFIHGDNLKFLAAGIKTGRLAEKIDMIYCDPPFFSRVDQGARIELHSKNLSQCRNLRQAAYGDTWNRSIQTYLDMLTVRLLFMKDALKSTGGIFIHLDWHAVHAVKLIMDDIFGEANFVNEIIWTYKSGGSANRRFARKHDTILFYSKSGNYKFFCGKEKSYNRKLKPYRFKGVQEFQDDIGWYTMVNQKDVWSIDMVGRSSGERLNYATQKPEALIGRIIEASTDEGDLCADFFCGSGTVAACAGRLGRRFICVDSGGLAVSNSLKRPLANGIGFDLYEEYAESRDSESSYVKNNDINEKYTDESNDGFKLDMVCKGDSDKNSGTKYEVAFESCELPLDDLYIKGCDKELLLSIMQTEPEVFADYWCMGFFDIDKCFHIKNIFFRDKKGRLPRVMLKESDSYNNEHADYIGRSAIVLKSEPQSSGISAENGVSEINIINRRFLKDTDMAAVIFDVFGRRYMCIFDALRNR